MDSLDVFSATCLYYFFVFVVFSLRGHRNKVIITVISSEVMSPVTTIMFKTQVHLFFWTKGVGNGKSCPLRFFQYRFSAVVVVAVYLFIFFLATFF